jgi:regulator of sirC expression with transglutaminase-like and TPR domain
VFSLLKASREETKVAAAIRNEAPYEAVSGSRANSVAAVRAVLTLPDHQLDYARAKVALDAIVDPGTDGPDILAELDRLADRARRIAGPGATQADLLNALRILIYRSGPWNGSRPFGYDHENFKDIRVKLLSHYLATRRGNCVSMPILFLILADKLGLDMSLAMAPLHFFLRHRAGDGAVTNMETTSGADRARDIWIRQSRGVSERGVASGFYMRSLSRREGVAAIALTVVEYLMASARYREALAVTDLIIRCNPRDGMAWANQAQACFRILETEFLRPFTSATAVPTPRRPEYLLLLQRNHAAFAAAQRLGFEAVATNHNERTSIC